MGIRFHSNDEHFEDNVKYLLLFHKIISAEQIDDQTAMLTLDNGTVLKVVGNEGCCGCDNGRFSLDALNRCDNAITDVRCLHTVDGDYSDKDVYNLYVFADSEMINCIQFSGYDNGCYGTGYSLDVVVCGYDQVLK